MTHEASVPVTDRYATKMLEKALRLHTVSMSERPMAEFLADKCDDLGFGDIRIDDEVGNIVAIKGSGRPVTMLCGHMDTVPGKIRVRREGDRLYGRGASDAKAPLMAMLFGAAAATANGGTCVFVGAVDEEGNATGAKSLARNGVRVPPGLSCKGVERELSSCVREESASRGVEAFYSILDETEPFEARADSVLVRALKIGTVECGEASPMPVLKTGTGDMNVVGNALGIPVVTWGPGDPHLAHMANEHVSISEYLRAIEILKSSLRQLKRLHDRGQGQC